MPRPRRIISASGYYHVMYRGNNKEFIFSEDKMKEMFINLIEPIVEEEKVEIAAYCIMNNHIHLILKSDYICLSSFSGKINRKYALRYNILHNRTGHAFEDRFRSEPIEDDTYLLQAIRYVHNNPVNAGIAKDVSLYKWSSYKEYIKSQPTLVNSNQISLIMGMFGDIKRFEDFHKQYDDNLYLDIKEEQSINLEKRAQRVIREYFELKGIIDHKQLTKNHDLLEELIKIMQSEAYLSQQKISELVGISKRTVHSILSGR